MNTNQAHQIREEITKLCKGGSKSTQAKAKIFKFTWPEVEDVLKEWSVMCQGAAHAMEIKCHDQGIQAYSLGIALPTMSHVVCLVGDDLIVHDPSFDLHYSDMSIFELLEKVYNDEQIERNWKPVETEYIHEISDELEPHPYRTAELIRDEGRRRIYRNIKSVDSFESFFSRKLEDVYMGELLYVRRKQIPQPEIENRIKEFIRVVNDNKEPTIGG